MKRPFLLSMASAALVVLVLSAAADRAEAQCYYVTSSPTYYVTAAPTYAIAAPVCTTPAPVVVTTPVYAVPRVSYVYPVHTYRRVYHTGYHRVYHRHPVRSVGFSFHCRH